MHAVASWPTKRVKGLFARAGLLWAMGLLPVVYMGDLALHASGRSRVVFLGLGVLSVWIPVLVCWLAVFRVGLRRWEVLLSALAVTLYSAAITYLGATMVASASALFFIPASVGVLAFYPLVLAALAVAVHRRMRGLESSVWLDGAVGSLGAAAVLAVVLGPVWGSAMTSPSSMPAALTITHPMFDLMLVAAIAGIAASGSMHKGSRWHLLVTGLMLFAAADVIFALQTASGSYVMATPLDAVWLIGLALIALWVDGAERRDDSTPRESPSESRGTSLVVSAVATAAGLGVLVADTWVRLPKLAVVLAAATLLVVAVRTQLAYHQLARMSNLRHQTALTDDLTGLPNRRALYAEGQSRLAEPQRRRHALLMLDLDKFKEVNDSLGHHAGDLLLVQVASRLREHVREGDVLARLGGDEFAVLLEDAGHHEATDVAAKLRAALAEPFTLEGITLHTSVSVGIAMFPDHGPDLSALLRKADIAMYKAKTSGTGHHVYRSLDDAEDATRLQTVEELRTALTGDQLVVHFQPKIDLGTGEIHSVEALVRWDHPTRGLLYPDAFLNLVEDSGLMPTLTRVVLDRALDQIAIWRARGERLTVAVNLSGSSLVDADLPEQVAAMLAARGVPPNALQLEITEEFLMADRDRARAILTRLRASGVQIAIDDFGTGYSSLAYLRDLPIDELKLDRSFVFPMADDARAAALVASTIALAHSLGLRMVAEGVETDVAWTELTRLGCDQAQGYFICRPVPAAELDHWLSTRRAASELTGFAPPLPFVPLGC
jgi:diguanylate cyclase (GGDEF)-like protein